MFQVPVYILWLGAVIALVAIEAATMGLTCIWFAIGALGALIVSLLGLTLPIQIAAFVLLSALSLILLKPFVRKHLHVHKTPTNADRVIGRHGVVTEDVDNNAPSGLVNVDGQVWTARAACETQKLPRGTRVAVREIAGVKLIVEPIKETEETKECVS